jgi:hypothetical protein
MPAPEPSFESESLPALASKGIADEGSVEPAVSRASCGATAGIDVSRCQVPGDDAGPGLCTIRRTTGPADVEIARACGAFLKSGTRWTAGTVDGMDEEG